MFEQSVLTIRKRPGPIAASFTLQCAFVAAGVLLSIVTIERLPDVDLPVPLPPLPAAPRAVEIVAAERSASAASASPIARRVFTAPVRIPARVATIVDDGPPASLAESIAGVVGTGLPPGLYSGTPLYTAEQLKTAVTPPPPKPQTPPAEAKEPARIKVGGYVMEAKIIRRVIPEYPRLARDMRISGTVRLVGVIGRDGTVQELRVISGHPLLVNAAVTAVRQWLYSPTLLNGDPVEVIAPIDVHFTLSQ